MSATVERVEDRTHEETRGIGLHGWGTIAWAAAGGISLGGFLVGLLTLNGTLSAFALLSTATGLFLVGSVLGLVHALALGYFGRPQGLTTREAMRDMGRAMLYAMVALPFAWVVTTWIALSLPAVYAGRTLPLLTVGFGWLAGAAVVGGATVVGLRMLENAYARWPERQVGTALVGATFASLLILFLMDRPEIWGLQLRLNETGAVLLAAATTIWVAGPIITLGLRMLKGLPGRHPLPELVPSRSAAVNLGLGLAVGTAVGLVAVPFMIPAAVPGMAVGGAGQTVLAVVGQALVDEVLLRLFLVSAVAWLLLRWRRVSAGEAAVASVVVSALVQVLLYTPGVMALGFASAYSALGFTFFMVLLPALVFGMLFWKRGLGAALAADMAALGVLAALTL